MEHIFRTNEHRVLYRSGRRHAIGGRAALRCTPPAFRPSPWNILHATATVTRPPPRHHSRGYGYARDARVGRNTRRGGSATTAARTHTHTLPNRAATRNATTRARGSRARTTRSRRITTAGVLLFVFRKLCPRTPLTRGIYCTRRGTGKLPRFLASDGFK